MPAFVGGPFDGQAAYDPATDDAPGFMAGQFGGEQGMPAEGMPAEEPQAAPGSPDWGGMEEAQHFLAVLDGARALIPKLDSEQSKLKIEKITTLLQEIKAAEEKEEESVYSGKMSPRLMKKAYSGGS